MKIGTHNSMTYLQPKQWWLWPFKWMAQCQSIDYKQQYDLGVRYFDMRVKYNKEGKPEFSHGLLTYKCDVESVFKWLNSKKEDIQIRLLLELSKSSADDERQLDLFVEDCARWEDIYRNLKFHNGRRKYDWKVVYDFNNPEPSIDQKVSSMLGKKWDDIFPFVWSYMYNKKFIEEGTDKEYLLLDFVQVQ